MVDHVKTGLTIDELMAFGEDVWVEIAHGEVIKADMNAAGFVHILVIENVHDLLKPFVKSKKLGRIFGDGLTYLLSTERTSDGEVVTDARIPDVSFIRYENIPKTFDRTRPLPGRPDLAVEIVSPTEKADELQGKITSYRRAGTEQIWVIYPTQQRLHVYLNDENEPVHVYKPGDILEAPTVFPGLKINIADLFVFDED